RSRLRDEWAINGRRRRSIDYGSALVGLDLAPGVKDKRTRQEQEPRQRRRRASEHHAWSRDECAQAQGPAWVLHRPRQLRDERLLVEPEVAGVRAHVAPRVDGRGDELGLVSLQCAQMLEPDVRRRRRLLESEAALATLGGEKGPNRHSRPRRSNKSSTSGRFISTSRD